MRGHLSAFAAVLFLTLPFVTLAADDAGAPVDVPVEVPVDAGVAVEPAPQDVATQVAELVEGKQAPTEALIARYRSVESPIVFRRARAGTTIHDRVRAAERALRSALEAS